MADLSTINQKVKPFLCIHFHLWNQAHPVMHDKGIC
ncbi:Uncharacterised protein [Vibrio cholerae]|nr:Uncharacterised protein [Vibrio cholerae]